MPSPRGSFQPRERTYVSYISCIGRRVLYHWCHLGSPWEHRGHTLSSLTGTGCSEGEQDETAEMSSVKINQ